MEKGGSALITNAESATAVYSVTAKRKFKLQSVIVDNPISGSPADVRLDDLVSSLETLRLKLTVRDLDTVALNKDELIGVKDFLTGVVAVSSVSGVWVHVGGYEY